MENYTNTGNFNEDYVRMKDGSYKSKQDLINDPNSVKIDTNRGTFGTAVDQLGNDLGTMGGGLLGLAGSDSALKRSQSNILANQYIDSQKDYGDFSGKGLLNLGVRNVPLMLGSLGAGAVAKTGTKAVVEGLLKKEMGTLLGAGAFNTGLGVAGGLQNTGQLNAQNYNETGNQLSTGQALTSFGTGTALNMLEGNALLGKLGNLKDVSGFNPLSRGANALRTGVSAGGINTVQDIANRATVDKSLADGNALSSYGQSFLTGAVMGAPFGALHSGMGGNTPNEVNTEQTTTQPKDSQITQDNTQVQPKDNSLLQLGYDPSAGKPVMYGTDNGIIGTDVNKVSDQKLNDYLQSGNQERVDANQMQPQENPLQLGYDANAGKPVMYGTDNGVIGTDVNKVSDAGFKSKFDVNQNFKNQDNTNNSPKSREELLQRIKEKQDPLQLGYDANAGKPVMYASDTGIVGKDMNKVSDVAFKNKFDPKENFKNQDKVSKEQIQVLKSISEDSKSLQDGSLTFNNKDLSNTVETTLKNVANDIKVGELITKTETTPVSLNSVTKEVATKKIKTPKIKNDFVKLNEKILENPSNEKIKLLNNIKNEIETSNVSDSSKLINTISKVADNLTENTAKSINETFKNQAVDESYIKEIYSMAKDKLENSKIELDAKKQENFNKILSNETDTFNSFDKSFDSAKPVIDNNGVEKYSMKDGNNTLEKVVDKSNESVNYFKDGQLHNEFGPALIEGKTKEYYLFDEKLSKKEWRDQVNELQKSKEELNALKKNENQSEVNNELPKTTKLRGNVLSEKLKNLVENNLLSDAVEVKKQNIDLPKQEQARIDSLNNSIKNVKDKVNVDIEVISPLHSIGVNINEQVHGWFDSDKNKIYIVGHNNIKETLAVVLRHELYHKGISTYLKGVDKEVFTKELDSIYQNKLVKEITDNIKKDPLYTKDHYGAIEEALSKIIENENNLIQNPGMFTKILDFMKNFLNKVLGTDSFKTNQEVKDFLDKTQKLALTTEETQKVRNNIENVIRFSKEIKSNDKTRESLQETIRNIKYNNQVDREKMNIAGKAFEDAKNTLNTESDTNFNPYGNPLGTKIGSNKFNNATNTVMKWFMKQDHLLSMHGKIGQSIRNVIHSVNTFKGDATSRIENESTKLLELDKRFALEEKGKIQEVLGRYAYEVKNSKDKRVTGQRIDDITLENELKSKGFTGQKLKDAINYSNEVRNFADYGIHLSKINDSIGIIETIKKTLNGYDEFIGDKIDTLTLQSMRNQFEKNGVKLANDAVSVRNFHENFKKIIDDTNIIKDINDSIAEQTRQIEADRTEELSQDVSNMTTGEHAIWERDINANYDAKLNGIVEKQHLDNINFTIEKLKEYHDEATTREERGYIHKDMSGKYFLTVKTMVNGKELSYTMASNDTNELSKISKELKDKFGNDITVNSGQRQTMNSKDLVQSLLSLEAYGGELTTSQMDLMTILDGYGDKIKREYSGPGYEQNLTKVLADYTYNKVNQMSSKHKMADISMLLNSVDGPNKVSIKAQLTDILQTMTDNRNISQDTVGSKIRGVTSIWALGANVSNTLAQVFQTGMIAPNLFKKYNSDTKWFTSLNDANTFLNKKTSGDAGLDSVLKRLENNDLLSSSMAKSMFEIKENPFGKSNFDKVKEKAYFLNEYTEKRLRYATAIQAFNIHKGEQVKKSNGKPFNEEVLSQSVDNFILNSISTVNGDFSKQNRAKMYQSDLVATLMMFQDWKAVTFNAFRQMDKQSQIKFALQHSALMGGVLGVPFADDIMEITDAFFRFFGMQPPAKKYLEKISNSLDENIIDGAGDYFKHGIPLMGEKIGLGQLIPNLKGATELVSGDVNKGLKGLIGPSGALLTNLGSGLQQVGRGVGNIAESGGDRGYEDVGRGFINMSPGVLKSVEKGLEVGATGKLESADGSVKMYDVNQLMAIAVLGNFRTPGMADTLDEYSVLSEYKKTNDLKMKEYKESYLDAYNKKDFKEMADITKLAKSINPSFDGKNVIKNDKTSLSMKERFLKSQPKDSQEQYKNLI